MINWDIVNKNIVCPICGCNATIDPETDGTEASHTHRFKLSREEAQRISDKYTPPLQKIENLLKLIPDEKLIKIINYIEIEYLQ